MDSIDRKAAKIEAFEFEKNLTGRDNRFNYTSKIITIDGSTFEIANSFIIKSEKRNYIYVFAEHYDTMVFDLDEVDFYHHYKIIPFVEII